MLKKVLSHWPTCVFSNLRCFIPQHPGEHGRQRHPALLQRRRLHPGHGGRRRVFAHHTVGGRHIAEVLCSSPWRRRTDGTDVRPAVTKRLEAFGVVCCHQLPVNAHTLVSELIKVNKCLVPAEEEEQRCVSKAEVRTLSFHLSDVVISTCLFPFVVDCWNV